MQGEINESKIERENKRVCIINNIIVIWYK